jgi:hypothetical protein
VDALIAHFQAEKLKGGDDDAVQAA